MVKHADIVHRPQHPRPKPKASLSAPPTLGSQPPLQALEDQLATFERRTSGGPISLAPKAAMLVVPVAYRPSKRKSQALVPGQYVWSNVPALHNQAEDRVLKGFLKQGRPFFYLEYGERSRMRLSGHMDGQMALLGDKDALSAVPRASFDHQEGWFCSVNPITERARTVGIYKTLLAYRDTRAVLLCLLRLSSQPSNSGSDAELTAMLVAAACYADGAYIERCPQLADQLATGVPQPHRERALALARDYAEKHHLVMLFDRLDQWLDAYPTADVPREPGTEMMLARPLGIGLGIGVGLLRWLDPHMWPGHLAAGFDRLGALLWAKLWR